MRILKRVSGVLGWVTLLVSSVGVSCGHPEDTPAGTEWDRTPLRQPAEPIEFVEAADPSSEMLERRRRFTNRAMQSVPERPDSDRTLSPYFFVASDDPASDRLPLKRSRAEVDIAGMIARIKVTQVYRNEGRNVLEALYLFPASTRAAVYAMRMTIGERVIEARIQEREQARQTYEQARRAGRTASLLEQHRPNVFQMNVANILPGDEIVVELNYTELLVPVDGQYEFVYPTVVGPRYSEAKAGEVSRGEEWVENPYLPNKRPASTEFGLNLSLRSGIPIAGVASPSHEIHTEFESERVAHVVLGEEQGLDNRDFVLRYAFSGDQVESGLLLYPGEEENFFLLMMEPPERITPRGIVPREFVFIMDVSGSMNGFPLEVSKALVKNLLHGLRPEDTFNILFFAAGNFVLSEKSLPASGANIDKAVRAIEKRHGGGGTQLLPALERALALPRREGVSRIIVIATDGYVRVEKEAFELIRNKAKDANVFPFGIGNSVNRHLIEGMARAGKGEPFVVLKSSEAERQAARFAEYISSPVMQGIDVTFEGLDAYDVEPEAVPDLFARRPVVVLGKYRGEPRGVIEISGHTPGERLRGRMAVEEADRSEDNEALRILWARERIAWLSDLHALHPASERAREVTRLGLSYGLMTAFTSFVAVDSQVRADGRDTSTVKQPLPLPRGVSEKAVGSRGLLQLLETSGQPGSGSFGAGSGYGGDLGALGNASTITGSVSNLHAVRVQGENSRYKVNGLVSKLPSSGGTGGIGLLRGGKGRGGKAKAGGVVFNSPKHKVKVAGKISREAVAGVVRKHIKEIQYCYQKSLLVKPGLAGKLVIEFVIGVQGTVSSVKVKADTLKSPKVAMCIMARIKKWKFPKPQGGPVTVTYPFSFHSVGF